jgi:hypothetical protein
MALGVGRMDSEGSRRLIQAGAEAGAEAVRGRTWTEEERDRHRQVAVELNLAQYLTHGYHGPRWTEEQVAWLGALPDGEAVRRTGRTVPGTRTTYNSGLS